MLALHTIFLLCNTVEASDHIQDAINECIIRRNMEKNRFAFLKTQVAGMFTAMSDWVYERVFSQSYISELAPFDSASKSVQRNDMYKLDADLTTNQIRDLCVEIENAIHHISIRSKKTYRNFAVRCFAYEYTPKQYTTQAEYNRDVRECAVLIVRYILDYSYFKKETDQTVMTVFRNIKEVPFLDYVDFLKSNYRTLCQKKPEMIEITTEEKHCKGLNDVGRYVFIEDQSMICCILHRIFQLMRDESSNVHEVLFHENLSCHDYDTLYCYLMKDSRDIILKYDRFEDLCASELDFMKFLYFFRLFIFVNFKELKNQSLLGSKSCVSFQEATPENNQERFQATSDDILWASDLVKGVEIDSYSRMLEFLTNKLRIRFVLDEKGPFEENTARIFTVGTKKYALLVE